MKPKLLLGLALVLCGGLLGSAIWLKLQSSPAAAVRQAYAAANAGNYLRADDFLLPPFLSALTNVPPKDSTRSFWDYYTRTQTVERVVIEGERIKDSIPPVTQFASIHAKIEFKNGQPRNEIVLLARGQKNHWQIYMVKEDAKSDGVKPPVNQP
jgi:hypothetical protein